MTKRSEVLKSLQLSAEELFDVEVLGLGASGLARRAGGMGCDRAGSGRVSLVLRESKKHEKH